MAIRTLFLGESDPWLAGRNALGKVTHGNHGVIPVAGDQGVTPGGLYHMAIRA